MTDKAMNMELYYEAENINLKLNKMNEIELQSEYAHKLKDRLEQIRKEESSNV